MDGWRDKRVCVLGMGDSGQAAARLLLVREAKVTMFDDRDLAEQLAPLRDLGADWIHGIENLASAQFDQAIISPGIPLDHPTVGELHTSDVPVWSELELGWRESGCLAIAITGTNGKTTTTELITAVLGQNQRRTLAAGNIGTPVCAIADQSRELDVLTLETSSFQLETIYAFRPNIAVLLNLAPDHLDRHGAMENYIRAKARIFENQRPFDHAIIHLEAAAELHRLGIDPPGKVITFSATDAAADLHLDRSLLISQLPGWSGPILDLAECQLAGHHNAENLLATLLVGRAMKLTVEEMLPAIRQFKPGPHRCELVAEQGGVRFFNDSKATNVHALCSALRSMPANGEPKNIWLIAGGQDKALDFHAAGPDVGRRVKGALLLGETRENLRAAWSLFAPCHLVDNLIEAVTEAGRNADPGDVVLLSPACASFDMFGSYQHRGEAYRDAVAAWLAKGEGD